MKIPFTRAKYPKDLIIKWRMNGSPPSAIAKKLGAKQRYIYEKLRVWKKKGKLKYPVIEVFRLNKEDAKRAVAFYKDGLSLTAVSNICGASRETIRKHLILAGVSRRSSRPLRITKCHRGHDITHESGNRAYTKHKKAFCLRCKEFRAKGLHLKRVCDKGHKIEGANAYVCDKKRRTVKCRICWREYLRNRSRRLRKTPKSKWRVA